MTTTLRENKYRQLLVDCLLHRLFVTGEKQESTFANDWVRLLSVYMNNEDTGPYESSSTSAPIPINQQKARPPQPTLPPLSWPIQKMLTQAYKPRRRAFSMNDETSYESPFVDDDGDASTNVYGIRRAFYSLYIFWQELSEPTRLLIISRFGMSADGTLLPTKQFLADLVRAHTKKERITTTSVFVFWWFLVGEIGDRLETRVNDDSHSNPPTHAEQEALEEEQNRKKVSMVVACGKRSNRRRRRRTKKNKQRQTSPEHSPDTIMFLQGVMDDDDDGNDDDAKKPDENEDEEEEEDEDEDEYEDEDEDEDDKVAWNAVLNNVRPFSPSYLHRRSSRLRARLLHLFIGPVGNYDPLEQNEDNGNAVDNDEVLDVLVFVCDAVTMQVDW
jgi:hypothetical protein